MGDLPPNNPDFYIQQDKINHPPIEHRLEGYPKMSKKVGGVVVEVKNGVATVFKKGEISGEAQKETGELNEELKRQFIEKLKKLSDYEGSKVQEAIENQTIEIKKIPNRKAYAIYESKTGNLVYITNLDGEGYMNIDHFRTVEMLSDIFKAGYIREGYSNIKLEDGLWKLYDKNGKEIPIFSDEYSIVTLNAINLVLDFSDYIIEQAEKKGIVK